MIEYECVKFIKCVTVYSFENGIKTLKMTKEKIYNDFNESRDLNS